MIHFMSLVTVSLFMHQPYFEAQTASFAAISKEVGGIDDMKSNLSLSVPNLDRFLILEAKIALRVEFKGFVF